MIPIPIYFERTYTATLKGSKTKYTQCRCCGHSYSYQAEVIARGKGFSPYMLDDVGAKATAEKAAHDNFKTALYNAKCFTPCPKCGTYQHSMMWEKWKIHILFAATSVSISMVALMMYLADKAQMALFGNGNAY